VSKWKKVARAMTDAEVETWISKVLGVIAESGRTIPLPLGFLLFTGEKPERVEFGEELTKEQSVALVVSAARRRGSRGVLWWSCCWTSEQAAATGGVPHEMADAKAELVVSYEDRTLGHRIYRAPLDVLLLVSGDFVRDDGTFAAGLFSDLFSKRSPGEAN